MPKEKRVPVATGEFCVRELDHATIVLSVDGEQMHALDEVGAFIWKAIDGQRGADEILELILAEYEVSREEAARDLDEFLEQLTDRGLIELRNV